MKNRLLCCAGIVVSLVFFAPRSYGKVYIDIHSPSATRLPIVILDFQNTGGEPDSKAVASALSRVISADLDFSGFFRILDPAVLGGAVVEGVTGNKIKWDALSIIGAEAAVTGGYEIKRADAFGVELRLFDAVQAKFITGKKYDGRTEDVRLVAHRFSNEIFEQMTGARGVFDTRIAYIREMEGKAKKEVFVMDYDGGNNRQVTSMGSLTLSPAWSPDGAMIAFTSYKNGNPDMYVKELYTGKVTVISRKKGINISPSWSPNGEKIALTLSLNNGNSEIYTLNVKNGMLERLTRDWATDVSPAWSPDGENLAFTSSRSGTPQILALNVNTGNVKRLTYQGNYNTSPDWSPRGDLIAYTAVVGQSSNIHVVSADGGFHQQLTYNAGYNEDPSWSPDGRYIAFSSSQTGRKEICIMRADGSGQKKITDGKGAKTDPAWAPFARK